MEEKARASAGWFPLPLSLPSRAHFTDEGEGEGGREETQMGPGIVFQEAGRRHRRAAGCWEIGQCAAHPATRSLPPFLRSSRFFPAKLWSASIIRGGEWGTDADEGRRTRSVVRGQRHAKGRKTASPSKCGTIDGRSDSLFIKGPVDCGLLEEITLIPGAGWGALPNLGLCYELGTGEQGAQK